jgi:hypothetical protein
MRRICFHNDMTRERKNYTPAFLMSLSQLKSALAGLKPKAAPAPASASMPAMALT